MKRRLLNQLASSSRALSLLMVLMLNSITAWAAGSSMLNFVVERADAGVYVIINCSTAAAAPTIKYSISYVDGTSVTNQTYEKGFLITSPCTITAYTEIDGKKGEEATAKYFGLASEDITGVVGGSVESPQIVPATDGAYVSYFLNDAPEGFASVDESTGTITQMSQIGMAYLGCIVYEGQEPLSFTILNSSDEFLSYRLTVVPPAPTIDPEGGTFEESQLITLSSTMSGDGVSIYYQWDNDKPQEYSEPFSVQNGTLTAWVVAHDEAGESYTSERVSADFVVMQPLNLKFVDPTIATHMVEVTEATATYNEGFTSPSQQPELYNPERVSVTYSSSDESVATIDQNGSVTIVGVGSTVISAYSAASSYMEGSASYQLTVSPRDIANATITIDDGQSYVYTGSEIEPSVTVTDGNITLTLGTDYTVNYYNNVDVPAAGSNNPPTIALTGTGNYTGEKMENFTITKAEAGLAYSAETASVALDGSTTSLPTLSNPAQLQVIFSSSDTNVATVHQQTGEVALVGPGTTTITATTEGDGNYNAGTASYTLTVIGEDYGIIVYTEQQPNGVRITEENKDAVLGEGDASVRFDGHNRLVLQDAQLSLINVTSPNKLPAEGLNIYLEGESTIENNSDYAIQSVGVATALKLTFSTGSDKPGSLTYKAGSAIGDNNVFQGYDVTYNDKLTKMVEGFTLTVKMPMGIVFVDVSSTDPELLKDINYANLADPDTPVATQKLVNTTINRVLYTLDDDGLPSAPDGYDASRGRVVLNSIMTDTRVAEINDRVVSGELVPTSIAYAEIFKGLTFLVPAGPGAITLTTNTESGFEFHLKVGSQEPKKVENVVGGYEMPYAASSTTYVYVYLVATSASAPAYDSHRAGPKATVSGGIGGIKIRTKISGAPDAAQNYCLLGDGDYSRTGSGITVNNGNVTDLPGSNIFGGGAPARAAAADNISFIDLSRTKITGKSYSRDEGAFAGLPETTYIYLPAGNTAKGKNFVIGGICDAMQLDESSDKTFEVAQDFFVAKGTFNRSFEAGDDKCYTVYLPFAVNIADVQGDFFTYDSYDNEKGIVKMSMYSGAMLSANTPYIFRPTATTTFRSPSCAPVRKFMGNVSNPEAATEPAGLHGLYQYYKWTSASANIFGFAADMAGGAGTGNAVKATAGSEMKPFRAYLRINATQAPTTLLIDWGEGTSIIPLDKDHVRQDADGWYTITGFRLPAKPTQKGVYIYKGKKVAVK